MYNPQIDWKAGVTKMESIVEDKFQVISSDECDELLDIPVTIAYLCVVRAWLPASNKLQR
jgi:hypothetical protein